MLLEDHPTGTISSVVKINGNLLTENNLTSSNAAKIDSTVKIKNKDTNSRFESGCYLCAEVSSLS